ncbi:uncharacterized protein P884DRAFT_278053 [Thermothelomyces heterothallicus CBS 202.75]|uniref:uncharacterized protein n=1 Tax=Thermothelomyces heterothallicus CBS 202.75 TaxID=1149848 RepID=UPI0037444E65
MGGRAPWSPTLCLPCMEPSNADGRDHPDPPCYKTPVISLQWWSKFPCFVGGIAESTSGPCVGRDPKESLFEVDRWRPVLKGAADGISGLNEVGYAKPIPLYVMLHRELSTKHGTMPVFLITPAPGNSAKEIASPLGQNVSRPAMGLNPTLVPTVGRYFI